MKISGIVCEYNPLHNGHLYHIAETRKNGASHIVCVMSGNFVQRGDTAILDKFTRAELAVHNGADLVIELPVQYSLSSAEGFARGAVYLLNALGVVDELSFGSETGDINSLTRAAELSESLRDSDELRQLTEQGMTYPRALTELLRSTDNASAEIISSPNNVLAIEYIRALKYFGSDIEPFTVKRKGAAHDSTDSDGENVSASYIRSHPDEAADHVPDDCLRALSSGTYSLAYLERVILYRLRTATLEELLAVPDSGQGLAQRIYACRGAVSLDELFNNIKSKRFTMARIRRVILSLLIGITKENSGILPPYIRVLAMNGNGREILSAAKKRSALPFGTSLARLAESSSDAKMFAELETRAGDIYSLAREDILTTGLELTKKTEISKNME